MDLDAFDERVLMMDGAVRSGKTYAAVNAHLYWALANHDDVEFGLLSRTDRQMDVLRNEIERFCTREGVEYHRGQHVLDLKAGGQHIKYRPISGNNLSSAEKIQSFTWAGFLADEVALLPEGFVNEAMLRCNVEPAKIVLTCNPENPEHWVNQRFVLPARQYGEEPDEYNRGTYRVSFSLVDNPLQEQAYIDDIFKRYDGHMRDRKLLGLWVAATGSIWPHYQKALEASEGEPDHWTLAVDGADSGTTHALLIGVYGDTSHVVREWRWDGREYGQRTHREMAERIFTELIGDRRVEYGVCDGPDLRIEIERAAQCYIESPIKGGDSVKLGINAVYQWIEQGNLKIDREGCPHLVRECAIYRWDEKAIDKGLDVPVKSQDHGCDAMRYHVVQKVMKQAGRQGLAIVGA